MRLARALWVALTAVLLAPAWVSAQTTYYVRDLTAVNVGANGSTTMTALADIAVATPPVANTNRAMTSTTAPTGTTRYRLRQGATSTSTNQEYFRAYTTIYASATGIAANATAHADFYTSVSGTLIVAKATLYEYNDTTGTVGAAKGTASLTGSPTSTALQTMNNASFGNAAFTVAAGNRLMVTYLFDSTSTRPAYLWGQGSSSTPSGYQSFTVTETVATTTVGNGTDPATASLAPGAAATDLDAFTLQTSGGTDTVTSVTVSLAAGTAGGLALVEVVNDTGTAVYGTVANPATDTVAIATSSLAATTTLVQYRVRITPRTHANMPAPTGSTYTVTGTVTAIASTNTKTYSDSSSATVTIDNLSPANATAFSGVAGDAQVALSWTNPAAADFSQVVVLRKAASAITDTPVEGTTYSVPGTLGASTIIYVGALSACTDTLLTNGTAYYYRIYAKDSNGNYASGGSGAGPYTPARVTSVGNGTDPANATVAPGAAATLLDAFTLQTTSATDTVTAVTVSLAAGSATALSLVEITDDAGGTVFG
jgi:hypothetical protein